jgi:heme A synthase
VGLSSANVWNVMFNPLYPDFTLHRVLGGIVMTTMIFSAIYAIKYIKNPDKTEKSIYIKGVRYGLYIGLPALVLQTAIGITYAIELTQYAPYISSAVFGGLYNSSVTTYYQFTPLFILFILIIALIWFGSLYNLRALKKLKFSNLISYMLLIAAMIGVPLGEYLNDASRFPYFVITGNTGISASSFINSWMYIPASFAYAAVIISAFLMTLFCILLYWVFIKVLKAKI